MAYKHVFYIELTGVFYGYRDVLRWITNKVDEGIPSIFQNFIASIKEQTGMTYLIECSFHTEYPGFPQDILNVFRGEIIEQSETLIVKTTK